MTCVGTLFKVTDNSGVKKVLAIRNLSKPSLKLNIGDLIVGVVKSINTKYKHNFSSIVYGVVVRLKKHYYTNKLYNYTFNDNSIVLVDKNLNPIGSRIFGSIPKYLKNKNYLKLNSLTLDLI